MIVYYTINIIKWSSSFTTWFESKCIRIAPQVPVNSIVFQANKYILVSWLSPDSTLFAYPGYEKLVAVFSGHAIDENKIIDAHLEFVFKNDTMWYIDSGESFEIIADSNQSIMDKKNVYCIMAHVKFFLFVVLLLDVLVKSCFTQTKKIRAIAGLQSGLRVAAKKLKVASYGNKYYYATNISPLTWMDHLKDELHRFDVKTTKTGNTMRWKMGYGVADCIAKGSFFTKTYLDLFGNDEIEVFVSNIGASFNLTSGRIIFKGIILKSTDQGIFGLTSLPKDCKQEFYISLMDISSTLRLIIIDYLSKTDLSTCKNVCGELAVECLEKLHC